MNTQKIPPKIEIQYRETTTRPLERVHIDYAGLVNSYYYFLIIDAYSKWPEIFAAKYAPTSKITIAYLKNVVARFGIPEEIVSDNALYFMSSEFVEFCNWYSIRLTNAAPYHPATNGQVEWAVQHLKSKLKKQNSDIPINLQLNQILFGWRDPYRAILGEKN